MVPTPPAEAVPITYAVSVDAGYWHTCVLTLIGNVDCYGENGAGEAEDYMAGAVAVSAGYWHTCVLTLIGNVDCYGDNSYGQAEDYNGLGAMAVSAGGGHTCVLTSIGNVDCYGDNWNGQAEDYTGEDAVAVSAGDDHTCVLTSIGNVDCYGANWNGQAEDYTGEDAVAVSAGGVLTCLLTNMGDVHCNGAGESLGSYGLPRLLPQTSENADGTTTFFVDFNQNGDPGEGEDVATLELSPLDVDRDGVADVIEDQVCSRPFTRERINDSDGLLGECEAVAPFNYEPPMSSPVTLMVPLTRPTPGPDGDGDGLGLVRK